MVRRQGRRIGGTGRERRCPHLAAVHRHFDRSLIREFFVGLRLENHGPASFLDGECVRSHAFRRPGGQIWPHWLPYNAEECEMVGEIPTRFLLSIAGILNNKIYEKYEVTQIEHDAVFGDEVFSFHLKSDVVSNAAQRMKHLASPSIAQSRVGFPVVRLTFLPEMETSQPKVMLDHHSRGESSQVKLMSLW